MKLPIPLTASVLVTTSLAAAQQSVDSACLPGLRDLAVQGSCIPASTVPTGGALLPLGPELFVAPTGEVGIGTQAPEHRLHVAGDLRVEGRVAFGGDGAIGPDVNYSWLFDLSHTITDFSASEGWDPFRSFIRIAPTEDLTGANAKYVYGHDLVTWAPAGNPYDHAYLTGPYMATWYEGTGNVEIMGGAFIGAESWSGHVESQGGGYVVSDGVGSVTIDQNFGLELLTGHRGAAGSIADDYSLYVYTPYATRPLARHYGIYLEDQEVGTDESYALYSAGGKSYFAGDVGIGTASPSAALHVDGDFVASGTKSFVQPHPTDDTKEIWFVCLEGNEAGTYFRGTATLAGGRAVVPVPEDFRLVTEAEGLTAQVTPMGPCPGLWVESVDLSSMVVRGERDVPFSYFVNGVRAGQAGFETVREARRDGAETHAPDPAAAAARDARLMARQRRSAGAPR